MSLAPLNAKPDDIYTVRTWLEGPRWASIPAFIRKGAIACNVEVVELNTEKGWIRETVFYKLRGTVKNLRRFEAGLNEALRSYNY